VQPVFLPVQLTTVQFEEAQFKSNPQKVKHFLILQNLPLHVDVLLQKELQFLGHVFDYSSCLTCLFAFVVELVVFAGLVPLVWLLGLVPLVPFV
jgi:hypothetical protein